MVKIQIIPMGNNTWFMQKLSIWPILIGSPIILVLIIIVLAAAVLLSPCFVIGFIFYLRAKNQRMKINTDYKLKVRFQHFNKAARPERINQ